jgi:uncharacterized protein DUF5753/helix-turn-helix protein
VSTGQGGSTVPRRQLGRQLRELRESARLTIGQAIAVLEWSKPRLWRYETGQVPIHPNDVGTMCAVYGASPELTEALKALARETKVKGWWHSYSDVPEWFELYLGMQEAASRIRLYEAEIIPGLVQSRAYAWETMRVGPIKDLSSAIAEGRVQIRMLRQRILTRQEPKAPIVEIMLGEAALVRGFDSAIMVDQLMCLLAFSERPNVTIRVIPFAVGPHSAARGMFHILDFPRESAVREPEPTTIYAEQPTGALYLDKPAAVATYSLIWEDLDRVALDQQASRRLITQRVEEWSR